MGTASGDTRRAAPPRPNARFFKPTAPLEGSPNSSAGRSGAGALVLGAYSSSSWEGRWGRDSRTCPARSVKRAASWTATHRVRRRRGRTRVVLALLHPLRGNLTAPPVSTGRARSPTKRTASQLEGAMGRRFANSPKRSCSKEPSDPICWTAMGRGAATPRLNAHFLALLHPLNGIV